MSAKRRTFLAAVAGVLATRFAPHVVAQMPERIRVVGYLTMGEGWPTNLAAHLRALGHVEGRNLRFEVRRVPQPATIEALDRAAMELVRLRPDVLVAQTAPYTTALHRATKKIPVVTYGVSNPVSLGVARSLRHPGMNVTGLSYGLEDAAVLQFGALRMLRPGLERVLFVVPAGDPLADGPKPGFTPEHASAAAATGLVLDVAAVKRLRDFETTFAAIRDPSREAAWIVDSPLAATREIADLAIRHSLATHGQGVRTVRDGLLVSCALIVSEPHRRVAAIIDKVLGGMDPGTIPFERPDRPEVALNRKTARAIGAAIPRELELRATEIFG